MSDGKPAFNFRDRWLWLPSLVHCGTDSGCPGDDRILLPLSRAELAAFILVQVTLHNRNSH